MKDNYVLTTDDEEGPGTPTQVAIWEVPADQPQIVKPRTAYEC